ncbi:DUF2798 domain-containing protein [Paenibacillus crassostreae]|uniref:DUF2798 domain-containing protein n=1 Tax=Paenibacillus crassostreae TaxID=1763538 RepID=A0A162KVP0_9BACL|nr:DUF2798 domain-containing protein [Paenibacillus crassostreae]AOZ91157.1 hypothetical protein LPB68_02325 [Paenibacillus crassostreae]OAB74683.1 hypothetical protein PNBC_11635 [Paenibacillus crassostreae]
MQQETRLPRNGKEGALYGIIICTLTALFMTTLNTSLGMGKLNGEVVVSILKVFPIMLVIAMILESVFIGRIAEKLVGKFTAPTDSFNSKILFRILFTVLGMSACMTLIGGIAGNGISSATFSNWLTNWPRNFLIVLIAESLVIQPIARFAMVKLHAYQDHKSNAAMSIEDNVA